MRWNWTQPAWPNFRYDKGSIGQPERQFLLSSGEILGAARNVSHPQIGSYVERTGPLARPKPTPLLTPPGGS